MLAALSSMSLPELAAWALVAGIPMGLAVLAWPLLGASSKAANRHQEPDTASQASSRGLGLPGQWIVQTARIEAALERQRAAMQLHRRAALQLGAVDHEIDRLWRDTREIMDAPASAT